MFFTTEDPVTGLIKDRHEYSSDTQLEHAIARLHRSFSAWKNVPVSERQKVLVTLAARMNERKNLLARLISEEMGKPIKDSVAEVEKCIQTTESLSTQDLGYLGFETVKAASGLARVGAQPLGVIYSIMPWNHPLWQFVRMGLPALLAGNTLLLKHSELTPRTGVAIEHLFAGLWERDLLLNLNIEHTRTEAVLSDARIGGVSLTGSVRAGREVYSTAGRYFKKTVLELGGSDPYLVLPDADLQKAAEITVKARLLNSGQTCISAKRSLVPKAQLAEFLELLKAEFSKYRFGAPLESTTDLGPLAHTKFKAALAQQKAQMLAHTGAEGIFSHVHGQSEASAFVDAEVFLISKNTPWLKDQEFFAPVLLVFPYESENEAVELANSTDFGLGAAVFSKDISKAERVANQITAGHVALNDFVRTELGLPFGGFKKSGLGHELGRTCFFEFTQTRVVTNVSR